MESTTTLRTGNCGDAGVSAEGVSENDTLTDVPREKKYSIERVTEEYLRMGVPYQKKNRQCTKVERFIKKHWPSPKMVQEMYSRKRDVNRKTLLLLYLVTEGMAWRCRKKVLCWSTVREWI